MNYVSGIFLYNFLTHLKLENMELGVIGILVTIMGGLVLRYEWWFKRWMKSVETIRQSDNDKADSMYNKLSNSIDALNKTIGDHNLSLSTISGEMKTIRDLASASSRE